MEVEEDNEEVRPEISLHVMDGIWAPKTMKILGRFKGHLIISLINSKAHIISLAHELHKKSTFNQIVLES